MTASENLSGEQFSAYRGLYMGGLTKTEFTPPKPGEKGIGTSTTTHLDPSNDEHVVGALQHMNAYHSRIDQVGPEHPAYNRTSPYGTHWTADKDLAHRFALDPQHGKYREPRKPGRETYGVVLEAHTTEPATHDRLGSQFGETEVKMPTRDKITGITAHLHRYDPANPKADTYVRSLQVPKS